MLVLMGPLSLSVVDRFFGFHILAAASTVSASCPHGVEGVLVGASLWCRTVSQTPMYGQPHGARINADVSASEAGPYLVEYRGKPCFWDKTPTVVCGPPLGPGIDLAEGWSWFRAGKPGRAGPANAPRSAHCLAGTHCGGRTPAVDQREGSDQRGASEHTPQALLSPPDRRAQPATGRGAQRQRRQSRPARKALQSTRPRRSRRHGRWLAGAGGSAVGEVGLRWPQQ